MDERGHAVNIGKQRNPGKEVQTMQHTDEVVPVFVCSTRQRWRCCECNLGDTAERQVRGCMSLSEISDAIVSKK